MKKVFLIPLAFLSLLPLLSCNSLSKAGKDGITPEIGENGNWFIGDTDTGIAAKGENGSDGITPHIGSNGNWFIGNTDTGIKAAGKDGANGGDGKDGAPGKDGANGSDGKDGTTPHIGSNGNWFIGDTDTGIKAAGKDGADGSDGKDGTAPHIGSNGNWFIGDTDTGIKATGLSAYEIYILKNPSYNKSEDEWLDDLINGRLSNVDTYNIEFDSCGGSSIDSAKLVEGVSLSSFKPTKFLYKFDGWYKSLEYNLADKVDTMPGNDIKLYAKWVETDELYTKGLTYGYIDDLVVLKDLGVMRGQDVIIPEGVNIISSKAMLEITSKESLYLPSTILYIGELQHKENSLLKIEVNEFNSYFYSNDSNSIIDSNSNELILGCKNTTILPSVKGIGERALYKTHIHLKEIPSQIKYIKSYGLPSSNYKLNEGIEYIGDDVIQVFTNDYYTFPKTLKYLGFFEAYGTLLFTSNIDNINFNGRTDGIYYKGSKEEFNMALKYGFYNHIEYNTTLTAFNPNYPYNLIKNEINNKTFILAYKNPGLEGLEYLCSNKFEVSNNINDSLKLGTVDGKGLFILENGTKKYLKPNLATLADGYIQLELTDTKDDSIIIIDNQDKNNITYRYEGKEYIMAVDPSDGIIKLADSSFGILREVVTTKDPFETTIPDEVKPDPTPTPNPIKPKPTPLEEYYKNLNINKPIEDVKKDLSNIINTGVNRRTYDQIYNDITITDKDPNNPNNVICMYTGVSYPKGTSGNDRLWNREHVWAKSHGFPEEKFDAYSDLHHLRASEKAINSTRSDLDFDDVENYTGTIASDSYGNRWISAKCFEPRNEVKGDIARMLLYMTIKYYDGGIVLTLTDSIPTTRTSEGIGSLGKLSTLIKWNYLDPVDDSERKRHEEAYNIQKNRNPFIDHPEFVDLLYPNSYGEEIVNKKAIGDVINLINTIPSEIMLSHKDLINNINEEYKKLSMYERGLVTNASKLLEAIKTIDILIEEANPKVPTNDHLITFSIPNTGGYVAFHSFATGRHNFTASVCYVSGIFRLGGRNKNAELPTDLTGYGLSGSGYILSCDTEFKDVLKISVNALKSYGDFNGYAILMQESGRSDYTIFAEGTDFTQMTHYSENPKTGKIILVIKGATSRLDINSITIGTKIE